VPKELHLVPEIPRNATGKILKAELRRRTEA
jgi:acyl-coenzyme A synthetase/AMP-(fatty) acid ligase